MTNKDYLLEVKDALGDLYDAHKRLTELWTDAPREIQEDLENILSMQYPYQKISFDDLFGDVKLWVEDGQQRIDEYLKSKSNEPDKV